MGAIRKLLSLIIWCSVSLHRNVDSQGYYYKRSNVNHYQYVNGRFQPLTTTTPQPGLIETLFPWTGTAYDSVRSPEEDAAIMTSLADNEIAPPSDDGILSWLPIPSMPSMNSMLPSLSLPGLPGFGSSQDSADNPLYALFASPSNNVPNTITFPDGALLGSGSQAQPVVVPGPENQQAPGQGFPPPQQQPQQQQLQPQQFQQQPQPQQVPQYPLPNPNYIHDVRQQVNPTFQFHQQMKDSIPIPSPSISQGFGQSGQPMFPYPYSAALPSPDFMKATPEKTASFMDMLSNYFTFGKRSDLENILKQNLNNYNIENAQVMDSRISVESQEKADDDEEVMEINEQIADQRQSSWNLDLEATREAQDKDFLCPKSGIWRWNGEVCIAVGPVPVWACKPNDLIVSGKIAICRNKIYFSPKVISTNLREDGSSPPAPAPVN